MERAAFIERIKDRKLINRDTAETWENLSETYPYAALIRLMAYQKKGIENKSTRNAIALYFENPLHLSHLTKTKITAGITAPTVHGALNTDSAEKNVVVQPMNDDVLLVEKIKMDTATEIQESENVHKNDDEAKKSSSIEPTNQMDVIQEVEQKVEKSNQQEDVLELINSLPDENPLKETKTKTTTSSPKETEAAEKVESNDPQHLMVMMSFTDWLQYYKKKNESEQEDKKGRDAIRSAWQKEKLAEAMDDEEDVVPDEIFEKAMKSVSFGDGLVTETLAELYVKQEKIDKAIELYKKLSLLNPEKQAYFASRIKDLHL